MHYARSDQGFAALGRSF